MCAAFYKAQQELYNAGMDTTKNTITEETSHARSVAKAISWRVIATLTTMATVYFISGEVVLALEVGAVEVVAKLLLYYLHERAWISMSWGMVKSEQTSESAQST